MIFYGPKVVSFNAGEDYTLRIIASKPEDRHRMIMLDGEDFQCSYIVDMYKSGTELLDGGGLQVEAHTDYLRVKRQCDFLKMLVRTLPLEQ